MKIYEITASVRALLDSLSDIAVDDGSTDAEKSAAAKENQRIMDEFVVESKDLKDRIHWMVGYAKELKTEREAREAKIQKVVENILEPMNRANQRDLKKEDWLLATVKGAMTTVHLDKLKFDEFTVALQKMPQTAVIDNVDALPPEYLRTIPAVSASTAPDKKKILTDLKDGVVVVGASLSQDAYKLVVK